MQQQSPPSLPIWTLFTSLPDFDFKSDISCGSKSYREACPLRSMHDVALPKHRIDGNTMIMTIIHGSCTRTTSYTLFTFSAVGPRFNHFHKNSVESLIGPTLAASLKRIATVRDARGTRLSVRTLTKGQSPAHGQTRQRSTILHFTPIFSQETLEACGAGQ